MYLRINVEDKQEVRIHFYFPRVYGFLEGAIFGSGAAVESRKAGMYKFYDLHKEDIKSRAHVTEKGIVKDAFLSAIKQIWFGKGVKPKFENKSPEEIDKLYEVTAKGEQQNSNRVLVHCAMGISRSASVIIMYIMKKFGVTFDSVCCCFL